MSRDESDGREMREAEALARALEGGEPDEAVPDEVLETAALLEYSRGEGELSSERQQAVYERLIAGATPSRPQKTWWRRWQAWLAPAAAAAAAAAMAAVLLLGSPSTPPATPLPSPPSSLLHAQLGAASGDSAATRALSSEMHTYRRQVLAALSHRYLERE